MLRTCCSFAPGMYRSASGSFFALDSNSAILDTTPQLIKWSRLCWDDAMSANVAQHVTFASTSSPATKMRTTTSIFEAQAQYQLRAAQGIHEDVRNFFYFRSVILNVGSTGGLPGISRSPAERSRTKVEYAFDLTNLCAIQFRLTYLFDCKPRLIKVVFIVSCCLYCFLSPYRKV